MPLPDMKREHDSWTYSRRDGGKFTIHIGVTEEDLPMVIIDMDAVFGKKSGGPIRGLAQMAVKWDERRHEGAPDALANLRVVMHNIDKAGDLQQAMEVPFIDDPAVLDALLEKMKHPAKRLLLCHECRAKAGKKGELVLPQDPGDDDDGFPEGECHSCRKVVSPIYDCGMVRDETGAID